MCMVGRSVGRSILEIYYVELRAFFVGTDGILIKNSAELTPVIHSDSGVKLLNGI